MLKITSLHIKRLGFQPFFYVYGNAQNSANFYRFSIFFHCFHHFSLIFALQTPFFHKGNEGDFKVKSVKNGSKTEILSRKSMEFSAKIVAYKHNSLCNHVFNILKISILINRLVSKCQSVKVSNSKEKVSFEL